MHSSLSISTPLIVFSLPWGSAQWCAVGRVHPDEATSLRADRRHGPEVIGGVGDAVAGPECHGLAARQVEAGLAVEHVHEVLRATQLQGLLDDRLASERAEGES